jgi:hypothetical protein
MREAEIRKRALKILQDQGFTCWYAPKTRYHCSDIFNIGDVLAWKNRALKIIQLTTAGNKATRVKRIRNYLRKNKLSGLRVEVWAYAKRNKKFIIEKI